VKHDREKAHNLFLAGAPFSDLKAFQLILASLPNKVQLQLGNSSVVRYAQLLTVILPFLFFATGNQWYRRQHLNSCGSGLVRQGTNGIY